MIALAILRLGAPHAGHVYLVGELLAAHDDAPVDRALVLVGSADVAGRADTPLPWPRRRDLLLEMLAARGRVDAAARARLVVAPLPELATDGWDARWARWVHDHARAALGGASPHVYVFGSDYPRATFGALVAEIPGLALRRIERVPERDGTALRTAIATGDPRLCARYAWELGFYTEADRVAIARAYSAAGSRR